DLVTIQGVEISTSPQQTSTWLTDNDDTTCNGDRKLASLQISWNIEYPFTWLRTNVKDS
ncbi:multiple epidermal growth factor-like domains protein 6, partial [Biomphalaria glabrata]